MRTAILLSLLLAAGGEAKKGKGGPHHPAYPKGCFFVGLAQLDKNGKATELTGLALPKAGTSVVAFDSEGKLGKLKVAPSEADLRFEGAVPERLKTTAFSRVLLVDSSLAGAHVLQPGDDLPKGVSESNVQLLLGDGSGPRVAMLSRAVADDDTQTCDELACKERGGWKVCFSNCPARADE